MPTDIPFGAEAAKPDAWRVRKRSMPNSRDSTWEQGLNPGDTVAISCGSHAIANYAVISKAVVDHFKGFILGT